MTASDPAKLFNGILADHAASQLRATKTVIPDKHRGWTISYDPPPIPIRDFDWSATHPDYDASYEGPEDGWVDNGLKVSADTRDALIAEIDDAQDEWEEANGQFGVGA